MGYPRLFSSYHLGSCRLCHRTRDRLSCLVYRVLVRHRLCIRRVVYRSCGDLSGVLREVLCLCFRTARASLERISDQVQPAAWAARALAGSPVRKAHRASCFSPYHLDVGHNHPWMTSGRCACHVRYLVDRSYGRCPLVVLVLGWHSDFDDVGPSACHLRVSRN